MLLTIASGSYIKSQMS